MKKALGILTVFALVATAAFAEVTVGAWGRGIFMPVEGTSEAMTYDTTSSWQWAVDGGNNARVGVTIAGSTEAGDIGFQLDLNGDGASINAGDNQMIWAKPFEGLTVAIGRIQDNTLRGNEAFGGWNWYRAASNSNVGEDITFARVDTEDGSKSQGFEIKYQNYGFTAIAMIRDPSGLTNDDGDAYDLTDMASDINFDAAYDIENIGKIKAGIHSDLANTGTGFYQFAFDLKAVDNLGMSVGFKMPQYADYASYDYVISTSGNYTIDATKLHFYFVETLVKDANRSLAAIGADYGLGGYGLCSDVTFDKTGETDATIGGTLGITKRLSNGLVGVAVQAKKPGKDLLEFAIPVKVEYWF